MHSLRLNAVWNEIISVKNYLTWLKCRLQFYAEDKIFDKLQGYADLYSVVMRAQLQSVSRIKENSRYWKRHKTRPATGLYSDGPSQVCIYLPFCSVVLGNGRLIEWNIFLIFGIAKPPDSVLHLIKAFRLLVIMLKSKVRVCVLEYNIKIRGFFSLKHCAYVMSLN